MFHWVYFSLLWDHCLVFLSLSYSVFPIFEEAAIAIPQQTSLQVHRPEVPGQEQNTAQYLSPGEYGNRSNLFYR